MKHGHYVAEKEQSTWYKIRNRGYSQMAGREDYSSVTAIGSPSLDGIRAILWARKQMDETLT
jgi:hypothetical protein